MTAKYGLDLTDPDQKREYKRLYMRDWNKANPEKRQAYVARRKLRNKGDGNRRNNYKYGFGVSPLVVAGMLEAQGGVCAICLSTLTFPHKHTHLDHDHTRPKRLRGVLCQHCNVGLGHFRDRADLLKSAAAYLEVFQ